MVFEFHFAEIIIIVLDSAVTKFHQILPSVCNPKLKLDFVTIPDDEDMGTADALRHIKDKIEVCTCPCVFVHCPVYRLHYTPTCFMPQMQT